MKRAENTPERILDAAERLVQTRGFNGFSYADVAASLNVTKASLHYHFRTKYVLGERLIARYHERFQAALEEIASTESDAQRRLEGYVGLYAAVLRRKRMCLCGMLAADHATLPKGMQDAVRRFFDANEAWLSDTLEQGRLAETLRFAGSAHDLARLLLASLEGAMIVARSYGEESRFQAAAGRLLADLAPTKPTAPAAAAPAAR